LSEAKKSRPEVWLWHNSAETISAGDGLGVNIFGMIMSRAETLYGRTLLVRAFFLICIAAFYMMAHGPFFLVMLGIVGLGFILTGTAYLIDNRRKS
jgi:hypothetical protein